MNAACVRPWIRGAPPIAAVLMFAMATSGRADVLSDWTDTGIQMALGAKQAPFVQTRTMAMVHVAIFDAVNGIERKFASYSVLTPEKSDRGGAPEAAAATAAHDVLVALFPDQASTLDATLTRSLEKVSDASARASGSALGHRAAAAIVALRASDGSTAVSLYRPVTSPGVYVATTLPVGVVWGKVKPWVMQSGAQFRPPPPPALSGADWARAFNEVKDLGGKASVTRSAAQTETARFWEMTGAGAYKEVVASATRAPGRSLIQNARLLALSSMALADSYIAVFDAKYTYNFWRPLTAIRNGDIDGNEATTLESGWLPLIDSPMHPEYPCAHCINAGAICSVLAREFGGRLPVLTSTSTTAPGITHTWTRVEDLTDEVSNARVWGGVHYRSSTAVGVAMGKRIGELVADTALRPAR
jgi:hypothetical protein